jgi:sulfoxide reductase heme-binding subunit YedZ
MAKPLPWLNPALVAGGSIPAALLVVRAAMHGLGANPISTALNQLGLLGLVLMMATLACTPLQLLFKWTWPIRARRTLGLLAFAYVTAHFLTYLLLDLQLDFASLGTDLVKRPFITIGFTAWLLLIPLAITSTDASVRRLGFKRWKLLHRLSYVIAILGVIHFTWRVKKDVTEPALYGALLAALLLVRVVKARK